ncbi:nucleolar complex protein 14 [Recurvomyces mirabilis]|uniref:Nucleolar complex protein 14 n=1 Tax=Recurvomyces mirabilis TaxID=574656 RepID=A0AAE1C2G5_9PEZI|nr:nucleolar complex protein 14 [Recurvomyces mirabilis]KAK5156023.1 nucleolar complex protein 14 [Recurvomyces mirabilis]
MPPSQLKALKSSLREKGIVGPQKSKKQKKSNHNRQNPQDRQAALQQIRDNFNPFELRQSARPAKFASVSVKDVRNGSGKYAQALHRPGVTKSAGEEMRRKQLLPEMRQRNKVGGLVDRRIGEGDASLTAEERAVQRFAREKSGKKGGNLFDLEGSDDEAMVGLTHLGRGLDDFDDDDLQGGGSDGEGSDGEGFLKRKRPVEDEYEQKVEEPEEEGEQEPERKKTKKEVMEEVISKSKFHKYERQKTKEDDEDLREQLDASMGDMLALLQGRKAAPKSAVKETEANGASIGPAMDPGRQAMMEADNDKQYEQRLREYRQEARAKPAERSKTEEEKLKDEAARLKEMEDQRQKRMRGEGLSEDEGEDYTRGARDVGGDEEEREVDIFAPEDIPDDAADFGFTAATAAPSKPDKVQHEDEDEFQVDDELIASDAEVEDVELSDSEESEVDDSDAESNDDAVAKPRNEEEEDEFVKGILGTGANSAALSSGKSAMESGGLSYTYPCPRSHAELLDVIKGLPTEQLPTVIQRIRALHHPSLAAANKESMIDFSRSLVDHISYMAIHTQEALPVIEHLIRHVHSLSRSYPIEIAQAFRKHLSAWHERSGNQPSKGDLMILVAIGSIYPTSDHFHQVVTPAVTLMARWLGLNAPESEEKSTTGAFMVGLCVSYQRLSKRYVPEAVRFTLRAMSNHKPGKDVKIDLAAHVQNVTDMADLWKEKSAFTEVFTPFLPLVKSAGTKKDTQHLTILLAQIHLRRRPLELHHHKKLAIRSSIPKFEEGFNPDKHYDPDKERSEKRKLEKEVKREKKGALRELRKDGNFVAREQLREKRERDAEYEKKQRRLIAEIQGGEGHESKVYEREKRARIRGKK